MELSNEALEARRKYHREYRRQNKEKVKEYNQKWQAENPDKVKAAKARYWEKKANNQ